MNTWDPMNDRFNFRCGITISHYDEDGNDIDTFLLVNNVSLFYDGEVGIRKEDLEDAILKLNLNEEEKRSLWDSLDEYETYIDWYNITPDFIEQCTGLKDKNGKLIYEGDIVIWNDGGGETELKPKDGWVRIAEVKLFPDLHFKIVGCFPDNTCEIGYEFHFGNFIYTETEKHLKIVGNIHENKELLK